MTAIVCVFSALLALGIGMLLFCVWGIICNEITYRQRIRLIRRVSRAAQSDPLGDWMRFYDWLNAVSYDSHLSAVMRFRDPAKLYGPFPGEVR